MWLQSDDPAFDGGLHTVTVKDPRPPTGESAASPRIVMQLPFSDAGDSGTFKGEYTCDPAYTVSCRGECTTLSICFKSLRAVCIPIRVVCRPAPPLPYYSARQFGVSRLAMIDVGFQVTKS